MTLRAWSSHVSILKQRRDSLCGQRLQGCLSRAFFTWKSMDERDLELQESELLSKSFVARAMAIHSRWHLLLLSGPIFLWAEQVTKRRQWRHTLQFAHRIWTRQSTGASFGAWQDRTVSSRGERNQLTADKQEGGAMAHRLGTRQIPRPELQSAPSEIPSAPRADSPPQAGVNPDLLPAGSDSWWSNMQRNMLFSELRLAHRQGRTHAPGYPEVRERGARREGAGSRTSPPRSGTLRFRHTP